MTNGEQKKLFADVDISAQNAGHIIRVAFESGVDNEFDYRVPDPLWPISPGQRVEVPFGRGNKHQTGFCVKSNIPLEESFASTAKNHLKKVLKLIDPEPLINSQLLELAQWISSYYVCPLGQVLAAMVPAAVKKAIGEHTEEYIYLNPDISLQDITLRGRQQKRIVEYLQNNKISDRSRAIHSKTLCEKIGCTISPLKSLKIKKRVLSTSKTVWKSLPVIPHELYFKSIKVTLNPEQQDALAKIRDQLDAATFGVTVLHGVTDSGKTELYIRAIEHVLRKGKQAIVLLPEIALTAQTIQRFASRFEDIAVMHSGLTAAQRNTQWQNIKNGHADVVIGARSAIFAPIDHLGLIVVDEEHEPSYKQDNTPRYHARDVAIKRAQLANAHCILGSATISLESLYNSRQRENFQLIRLTKRVMDTPMPQMKLVDMRDTQTHRSNELISKPLQTHLTEAIARHEQAILLLNRRGYSNFIYCPSCRFMLHCRNCDVTLTFHKKKMNQSPAAEPLMKQHMNYGYALCHHCGVQTLVPRQCPVCQKHLTMIGMGTQRLEEELHHKFPAARSVRIDSDSMSGRDYYEILGDFAKGKIDILAGTQILAKGLHFPNVTVVGIISADTCLYLPDFRTNERTFQLISQVAGRAGRGNKKGTVYIQTYLADQPVIDFALRHDFEGFVSEELKHRKSCDLPPFWRMAMITLRDQRYDRLETTASKLRQQIDAIIGQIGLNVKIRGPLPAVISRIQQFHRMQIVIQAKTAGQLHTLLSRVRYLDSMQSTTKVAIDVDPVNLL